MNAVLVGMVFCVVICGLERILGAFPCACGVLGEVELLWSFELALALAIRSLGF